VRLIGASQDGDRHFGRLDQRDHLLAHHQPELLDRARGDEGGDQEPACGLDVETPWGIVTSVITTRSIDQLELVVGSEVVALVKSTEVSIAKL
jgi:molybdopterin-binding protein